MLCRLSRPGAAAARVLRESYTTSSSHSKWLCTIRQAQSQRAYTRVDHFRPFHSPRYCCTPTQGTSIRGYASNTMSTTSKHTTLAPAPGSHEVLQRIRERMKLEKEGPTGRVIDAYIVPHNDNHSNEYIAEADERLAFVTGFTGSYGDAVITQEKAILWTDGRYVTQAKSQLNSFWSMINVHDDSALTVRSWIAQQFGDRTYCLPYELWTKVLQGDSSYLSRCIAIVAIDPSLFPVSKALQLASSLASHGVGVFPIESNFVDSVWRSSQPERPREPLRIVDTSFSGISVQEKVEKVRGILNISGVSYILVTALDEIAWLLNLRGTDIAYNPLFFAYVLLGPKEVFLYMDQDRRGSKEPLELLQHQLGDQLRVKAYSMFRADVAELASTLYDSNSGRTKHTILIDPQSCSLGIQMLLPPTTVVERTSPIKELKSIKTQEEIEGMRRCHIRDGRAIVKYLAWLHDQINSVLEEASSRAGKEGLDQASWEKRLCEERQLTEYWVAEKLKSFRQENPEFKSLSFETISSTGSNGAVIHYSPTQDACSVLDPHSLYLCDSGGQYSDGTTDITRTVHFSRPTEEQRKLYTLVLKGFIACSNAVFPHGAFGYQVDGFARQFLWNEGLNYSHGTGHGVGAHLNVHEAPPAIRQGASANDSGLKPGMIFTIEPGYYEEGKFGIRIEDVLTVRQREHGSKLGCSDKSYCYFESITCAPLQTSLMELSMLTPQEKEWVNAYNKRVQDTLLPLLDDSDPDEKIAKQYLLSHRTDLT
eukprot:gb/GECG01003837.1/.p1 GENE.gb/GECG01003837.1/~~gb/GECG01003837.1/.p1  ORF type:complete len:764 (+),score=57.86 gb/GECG01003837.1/:1-2292(+)